MAQPKAIITIGIPCSGKSTWAEDFCRKNGYVEVNRDNARMALFELERYNDYKFSKGKEQQVTEYVQGRMIACALINKDMVISDTNLNTSRREALQELLEGMGYEVSYKVFDVEFFDALRRNDKRTDKHIPRMVMYNMYRSFMKYKEEQKEWTKYVPDSSLPSAYIVDIDGTIARNDGTRGWYDWSRVGEDNPVQATINVTNKLFAHNKIIILSGRDEVCRNETIDWLRRNGVGYDYLYMRPKGSMDKDRYVKHALFNEHVNGNFDVQAVFDDRPQVCLLWHDLGLPIFKVGDPIIEF